MKLLICGNSKRNLKENKGNIIDTYDDIIRFNGFQIENYENFIGTKTTIWVCSLGRFKKQLKNVFLNSNYKKVLCNKSNSQNDIAQKELSDKDDVLILDKNVHDYFIKYTNYPKEYFMSNGFLIILYFMTKYDDITITNFEFSHTHYYEHTQKPKWKNHNWKFEKQYIQNLIDKNIIQEI